MSNPEMYNVGYEDAIEMVLLVMQEMLMQPDVDNQFDTYTLEQLRRRIA